MLRLIRFWGYKNELNIQFVLTYLHISHSWNVKYIWVRRFFYFPIRSRNPSWTVFQMYELRKKISKIFMSPSNLPNQLLFSNISPSIWLPDYFPFYPLYIEKCTCCKRRNCIFESIGTIKSWSAWLAYEHLHHYSLNYSIVTKTMLSGKWFLSNNNSFMWHFSSEMDIFRVWKCRSKSLSYCVHFMNGLNWN